MALNMSKCEVFNIHELQNWFRSRPYIQDEQKKYITNYINKML